MKKRIKISSAKGKGRRLQQWVAKKISEVIGLPYGKDQVIESREMGQTGTDIKLYGLAKDLFPYSVECKYQEKWSLIKWIKDTKVNKILGTDWLLFIKKNRHEEIVIMDAERFFDLHKEFLILKSLRK